jgi:hypothetical protein
MADVVATMPSRPFGATAVDIRRFSRSEFDADSN